jgi:beta-glucosidase
MPFSFALPSNLHVFPKEFLFGTATAAYQIEGAVREGGRGVSIWDSFSHSPNRTHNGETGDIACDHFHRWEADLDLMRAYGLPAYRLSLSWTRLQPTGRGPLNPDGVAFYRGLLQGCRDRGITPLVTLYHWDLPQPLQDAGGWPERDTAYRFAEYAERCIDALGDLANDWITINEPWCISFLSHAWGAQAPGVKDDALALRAAHHTLLAHGLALPAFRSKLPHARVGITNITSVASPGDQSPENVEAARVLDVRMNRIFLDPVYLGAYTPEVLAVFGIDGLNEGEVEGALVQPGDLALISAPTDFVGVNHYHNMVVTADPTAWRGLAMQAAEPTTGSWGWSKTGWALRDILIRINRDYSQLPVMVTENGVTCYDYPDTSGEVRDPERIEYYREYLEAVGEAIEAGVPVIGYMAWSFMDNFEWAEGFSKRFGLVYVDYPTQTRIPKQSAAWYRDVIAAWRAHHTEHEQGSR